MANVLYFEDLTDKELYVYMLLLDRCRMTKNGIMKSYVCNLEMELQYKAKKKSKKCLLDNLDNTVMTLNEFFDCCKSLHKKGFIKKWYYNIHVHGNGGAMDEFSCQVLNYCSEVIECARKLHRFRAEIKFGERELKELREELDNKIYL